MFLSSTTKSGGCSCSSHVLHMLTSGYSNYAPDGYVRGQGGLAHSDAGYLVFTQQCRRANVVKRCGGICSLSYHYSQFSHDGPLSLLTLVVAPHAFLFSSLISHPLHASVGFTVHIRLTWVYLSNLVWGVTRWLFNIWAQVIHFISYITSRHLTCGIATSWPSYQWYHQAWKDHELPWWAAHPLHHLVSSSWCNSRMVDIVQCLLPPPIWSQWPWISPYRPSSQRCWYHVCLRGPNGKHVVSSAAPWWPWTVISGGATILSMTTIYQPP